MKQVELNSLECNIIRNSLSYEKYRLTQDGEEPSSPALQFIDNLLKKF